ncbi:MAG: hypothetical protein ACI3YC_07195 [Alloprevotella sp.]
MKRLYSILSLLLLFVAGATNLSAQEFSEGTLLTTTEEVAAQSRFILKSPGTSRDHPSGYVWGTKQYKQSIDKSCLFTLEAVEGETADGFQVYLLKQVETGLYFKDFELGEYYDSSDLPSFSNGDFTDMTDNKAQAMKFTVLPFEDVTGQTVVQSRTSATNAKQALDQVGFVFARAEVSNPNPDGNPYTYLGGLGKPFYSRYVDTNVHQIYTVTEKTGLAKVVAYAMAYFPGSPSKVYPPGVDPGYYPADLVAEAEAIYTNVAQWNESGLPADLFPDEAAVDAYCARIVELAELLQKSVIKVETGYYFIHDSRGTARYWRPITSNNKQALGWSAYTVPETLDVESARHIWKVTKSSVKNATSGENEDVYTFQSYFTNEFVNVAKVGDFFSMGEAAENFTVDKEAALEAQVGSFVIYPYGKSGQKMNTFNNGGIAVWNWVDEGNCFRFQTVSEEAVAGLEEAIRQAALNEKLQTVLTDAQTLKSNNDGSLGMVTNGSQLSANFPDAEAPDPANLLDNNVGTYFHTSWRNTEAEQGVYHYIQADLGIAVDGLTLEYAKRWRTSTTSNHAPLTAIVEVTNDPEGEWTTLTDLTFDYNKAIDYPASVAGKDTTLVDGGGEATIDFPGNKYRHIRLSVTSVLINEKSPEHNHYTYPFWYLAELHFKSNATPNYAMLDEALRTRFETLMAQAAAEIQAGAATQETIDALTAAYNEVLANIPDPIRIVNAVAEAKALRAKAQAGTEPGYFPYAAIEAFDAAIAAANDAVKAGITLEEIESTLAALDAATAEFNASLILPEVGTYYHLRSASTKVAWTNDHWNSAKAPLYSTSNAAAGALKFTYLEGSSLAEDQTELTPIDELTTDSVDVNNNPRYAWLVEEAGDGKITLRNAGTGMYLSEGQTENLSGSAYQSAEKTSVTYYLAGPGKFVFVAGVVDGQETYFNCNSTGGVVTWSEKDDENGFWSFETIDPDAVEGPYYYLSLTPGRMHIVTLPVDVMGYSSPYGDYILVGQSADNKLVLVEGDKINEDCIIPAGTPFIVNVPAGEPYGSENIQMEYFIEDGSSYIDGTMKYVFEPVKVAGLQGTICETAKAGVGCAVLNANGIQGIKSGNIEVGVNSGYFDGTQTLDVDAAAGDLTLDLPEDFVLNSINDAVVLKGENNNVYSVSGVLVRKNVKGDAVLKGLPAGIYIVNGEKVVVK